MIVAVHQPSYMPYLGFFHKMLEADAFILYDTAQYSKNDFHNRNRIKTPSGPRWLTVPVQRPGKRPILDVAIENSSNWPERHMKSLQANYSRAAHFAEPFDELSKLLCQPWAKLAPLNTSLIELFRKWLNIPAKLVLSSNLGPPPMLTPTDRLLWMVRKVGGTAYLSGSGGKAYLDEAAFGDVRLLYDDFHHPKYPQLFGSEFLPNLSAVDAIFVCGASRVRAMLEEA